MSDRKYRIIVLTSGKSRGSNLEAIANYIAENSLPIEIVSAIKTRNSAPMTDVCLKHNIHCLHLPYSTQHEFEDCLIKICTELELDAVVLAGFLKKLSERFINKIGIPVLNIHPALLPQYGGTGFYGSSVHQAVFEAHEKRSGATVHLVDSEYDHGSILAQRSVDISNCKSPDEVAAEVLKVEHQIYGETIWKYLQSL